MFHYLYGNHPPKHSIFTISCNIYNLVIAFIRNINWGNKMKIKKVLASTVIILLANICHSAIADEKKDYSHKPEAQDFIHGAPEIPSDPWLLSAGGRIYDNWWNALDRTAPEETNPAYPASAKKSGASTWRCKECHGWDYRGSEGVYSKGSHFTGIKGISGASGKSTKKIMVILRDKNHPYTTQMIDDDELARVAAFVSRGQVDVAKYVNLETRKMQAGNVDTGRGIFQTVCAACHGFDGRLLDWGDGDTHNYVGTEAANLADEVLHKVLNAHPGVQMVNLRAFPIEYAINLMAYISTLPQE